MSMNDVAVGQRSHLMATYSQPSHAFVRGSGAWLQDDNGSRYLDFLSGLAVTSLGHSHPAIARAVTEQVGKLVHVSNLYQTEHAQPLAAAINDLHTGEGRVFFGNSGAEAVECAIKLARRYNGIGRHTVCSLYGSFHGRTLAALHATGQPSKHEVFQPLPEGFIHVAANDIDAADRALTGGVGAMLIEIVQGEGGVVPLASQYLDELASLCAERQILLMIDEVQTGFARTGEWFAYQLEGLKPDVVTMAKALGNGLPIGACWARNEVADSFKAGDHGSTYGGNPLVAAAARAVLATMSEMDAPAAARAKGAALRRSLEALPGVLEVRGHGLLLGAELDISSAQVVQEAGRARGERPGLLVNAVTPTAVRFAPPLIVEDDEVDLAVEIFANSLEVVRASVIGGSGDGDTPGKARSDEC